MVRNRLACLLLVFGLCSGSSLPVQAQSRAVAGWTKALDKAEKQLDKGKWHKAYEKSDRVAREMIYSIQKGTRAAELFGRVFKIQALAKEGMGDSCEAAWNWGAAQYMNPGIQGGFDYEIAGPVHHLAPEACGSSPWAEMAEARCRSVSEQMEEPKGAHLGKPMSPKARGLYLGQPTAVNVRLLITLEGRVCGGEVLHRSSKTPDPMLTASAMHAMRAWRFTPARFRGEPVPVAFNFTVTLTPPDLSKE